MNTLLKIQTSLSGDASESSRLATRYAEQWLARHPGGRVLTRDLARDPVPHLTAERFAAFAAAPEERTVAQRAIVGESDALIAELQAADVVVLAVPMHNFSVPSTLRAYFDHVARAGITFRYTAAGPEGLLTGKRAVVIVTRGGYYPEGADLQVPYVRQFLGFVGITDVDAVVAEGLAISAESRVAGLERARQAIATLVADPGRTPSRQAAGSTPESVAA
ncbi:MAG: NAD(P)H-dependent oxidoreductase [Steroidobacteraceae bacterium]|jgi:FMN-dependent NADH-azoreductase|nr:NAD(P)H-dependent oxidoreductase [Steroidobacteraceae bacterium]